MRRIVPEIIRILPVDWRNRSYHESFLGDRAVLFALSDSESARALYDGFRITTVQVNRAISTKAAGRGPVSVILVTNVP